MARAKFDPPDQPDRHPAAPDWIRRAGPSRSAEEAAFYAGASLAVLASPARDVHPIGELWRERLAIECAANVVGLIGRRETVADLRDAWLLRSPGADPGPAGRVFGVWRGLGQAKLSAPFTCVEELAELETGLSRRELQEMIDLAMKRPDQNASPVAAATEVAVRTLQRFPLGLLPAAWLADLVLAEELRWKAPIPLLASRMTRRMVKEMSAGSPESVRLLANDAYREAAVRAVDLNGELCRKARSLIEISPNLRSKGADRVVRRLLSEDALSARSTAPLNERSARRLFERLSDLGAIRELTGRPTFRLYGL
ncbi:DUF1403 family protein [Amorphus sp. 3PC139-8]|uniref:DUF1403 family protein n=1 Tax=Amorphus sp. 3PC139-8 TaxID=2735676 RepID=UPI00345DAA3F